MVATIPVDGPRLGEVSAFGPLVAHGAAVEVATTVSVLPPPAAASNPAVLVLPGLVVRGLSPPTHVAGRTGPSPVTIAARATVTGMCGGSSHPALPEKPEAYGVGATIRGPNGFLAIPVTWLQR